MFGPAHWTKFVVVTPEVTDDIQVFLDIHKQVSDITLRPTESGRKLVEVQSEYQSTLLNEWLCSPPSHLSVNKNALLNSSTGTVVLPDEFSHDGTPDFTNMAPTLKQILSYTHSQLRKLKPIRSVSLEIGD